MKGNERLFNLTFASIYPLYVQKVEKKQRSKAELDEVILWLTGYDKKGLRKQITNEASLEIFFANAPEINPNARLINGVICGVRVEEITDPLVQKIRWMDKLVDELARGKAMKNILRKDNE
jgi:hypothetical protein